VDKPITKRLPNGMQVIIGDDADPRNVALFQGAWKAFDASVEEAEKEDEA